MGIGIFFMILGYFCIEGQRWNEASNRVSMMATTDEMPNEPRSVFWTTLGIIIIILGMAIIVAVHEGYLPDK